MSILSKIEELIFGEDGYVENITDPSNKLWLQKLGETKFNIYEWEAESLQESITSYYNYPQLFSLVYNSDNLYLKNNIAGHRFKCYRSLIDYECFMIVRNLFIAIKHNEEVDVKKLLVLIRYYLFETKVLENKFYDHFLYACYGETSYGMVELDKFQFDNEVPACNYLTNSYMRIALANLHDTVIEILGFNHSTTYKLGALSDLLLSRITNDQYTYIIFSTLKVEETLDSNNIRKIELVYNQLKNLFYEHVREGTPMDSRIVEYLTRFEKKLFVKKILQQSKEWKKRDNDDINWHLNTDNDNILKLKSFLGKKIKIDEVDEQEIVRLIWAKVEISTSEKNLINALSFLTYNNYKAFLSEDDLDNLDELQACNKLVDLIIHKKSLLKTKSEKKYFLHIYLQGIAQTLNDRNIGNINFPSSLPRLVYQKLSDLYEIERNIADDTIEEMERGKIKPINVNMSVSDLALLFKALHHVDAIDASSKRQLFSSVSQMFTTSAKDGQKISENSFKNSFNESNINSYQYWRVKFKKMLDFIADYK